MSHINPSFLCNFKQRQGGLHLRCIVWHHAMWSQYKAGTRKRVFVRGPTCMQSLVSPRKLTWLDTCQVVRRPPKDTLTFTPFRFHYVDVALACFRAKYQSSIYIDVKRWASEFLENRFYCACIHGYLLNHHDFSLDCNGVWMTSWLLKDQTSPFTMIENHDKPLAVWRACSKLSWTHCKSCKDTRESRTSVRILNRSMETWSRWPTRDRRRPLSFLNKLQYSWADVVPSKSFLQLYLFACFWVALASAAYLQPAQGMACAQKSSCVLAETKWTSFGKPGRCSTCAACTRHVICKEELL